MGFWQGTKAIARQIINVRFDNWVDLDNLKATAKYFTQQTRKLFTPQKSLQAESFDDAVMRLGLSAQDLHNQANRYKKLAILFFLIGMILLVYGVYIACFHKLSSGVLSLALSIYAMTKAMQFHFWYFQISQQKLGCSARTWLRAILSTMGLSQ